MYSSLLCIVKISLFGALTTISPGALLARKILGAMALGIREKEGGLGAWPPETLYENTENP